MAGASDVPSIYDVVINGVGYMFDKRREGKSTSVVSSGQALLGYTPTFVPRSNTSGGYGDNEQDFFLTTTQKDWSGGAEQRYWGPDDTRSNRFYASNGVEISSEGEFRVAQQINTQTITAIYAGCGTYQAASHTLASAGKLFYVNSTSITDLGSHGAGTPAPFGVCADGAYHYISGTGRIRKMSSSAVFSDFATSGGYGSICHLNNQLYACNGSNLWVFSSAGVPTLLFPWVDSTGVAASVQNVKLIAYGASLLIFFPRRSGNRPELWMYDGSNTFRVAQLPIGTGGDIVESNGIVFISSSEIGNETSIGTTWPSGVIYAWVNGSIQEIWRDEIPPSGQIPPTADQIPVLGLYDGSVVFTSVNSEGHFLRRYMLENGATETIAPYTLEGGVRAQYLFISSGLIGVCLVGDTVDAICWPSLTGVSNGVGTLDSSLYDFGSSLVKLFRSVRVDFDKPAGTTVDLYYQLNGLKGTYTLLAGDIDPGVEYSFPDGLQGNSVSLRLKLTAAATVGPVVRKLYVRAAPFHQAYRKSLYHLDLSGSLGKTPVMHRDGSPEPSTGIDLARQLYSIVTTQTVVTITDVLGTYTGLLDPDGFEITQFNPDEFIAAVPARQV